MILEEQALRPFGVESNFVDALAEFGILVGHEHSANAAILGGPTRAAVVGAVNAASGDCDVHALLVGRIENDGMQGQSAVTGHPARAMGMIKEPADERPCFT